jgi:hypothetical protein
MKKRCRLALGCMWGLFVLLLFMAGCGAEAVEPAPRATLPPLAERGAEEQALVGQWRVNQGEFGNKVFDFGSDGRLLITDADSGEIVEMTYLFMDHDFIALSGYDPFNGAATLKFYEDKLDFTIKFSGAIYSELYIFTRLAPATN